LGGKLRGSVRGRVGARGENAQVWLIQGWVLGGGGGGGGRLDGECEGQTSVCDEGQEYEGQV